LANIAIKINQLKEEKIMLFRYCFVKVLIVGIFDICELLCQRFLKMKTLVK